MATLTADFLDKFVGKTIVDICPLKFGTIGDKHNHCAHFVGHVMKLNNASTNGFTCAGMVYSGKSHPDAGAVIRVNDLYNICIDIDEPDPLGCLAYYTLPNNIDKNGFMGTMSQKHVGICHGGYVYNYGNSKDAVRKDKVGDLAALYGAKTITRYTKLPPLYTLLTLEEIQALVPAPAKKP